MPGANHLYCGSLMLGRACSSFKIMMTAGTTKTAATMRTINNTKPMKQPRRVRRRRRDASCAGGADATFCRGGRNEGAFAGIVGVRRGAGAFGEAIVGGGLTFGDCAGSRAGAGVVPLGG